MLVRILERVCHVELGVNRGDAEGRVPARQVRVPELAIVRDLLELRVEDIDRAGVEVGGEQERAFTVEPNGKAFIHRAHRGAVYGDNGIGRIDVHTPPGDGSVLGGE